jgi:hypothetical protein
MNLPFKTKGELVLLGGGPGLPRPSARESRSVGAAVDSSAMPATNGLPTIRSSQYLV